MKKVLVGLLVLGSFSSFAGEVFKKPQIANADIVCENLDLVCEHLGYKEAVEFSCKRKLRHRIMRSEILNYKSVEIKERESSCEDSGQYNIAKNALAELQLTADVQCYTYAKYGYETRNTTIIKSIECQ